MPVVVIAVVVAAVAPPVKSSSAANGAAAGPPAEMSTPPVAAAAFGTDVPMPATRADTTSAAIASRLTAARREPGARPARLRCLLLSGFRRFTFYLQIGVTLELSW